MMLLQAAYLYELDKRGHNTVVTETMRLPDGSGMNHQVIAYNYDPLYRITEAAYTGVLSGTYAYEYNAVGSRVYFSTNITHTETTTYTYNIANQLQESKDLLTAELTTYDWDDAGRLITTTVANVVDKAYQYSQDGDLTRAEVDGLVTTFAYDGNGSRLQMSVAGETTTYLPDYGGRSSRVLFEQGTAETKQYLYGVACLGEFVTDNTTSDTEWRYYQRDAKSLVRQTTNEAATITLAWTFSPEGGVLLGEEGPVTHLGCGDDAVYDWSTGLIFKSGRYFDPNNGIWITMSGAMIWQKTQTSSRRKRRMSKKLRYLITIFLLLVLVLALTGCGDPSPDLPECPTPPPTPIPSETPPPPIQEDPTPVQVDEPPTITPVPIDTPSPNPTPLPSPSPEPMAGFQLADPFGSEGNGYYWNCLFGDAGCGLPVGNHDGIDLVSKRYIDKSCGDSYPYCVNFDKLPLAASPDYRAVYSPVTGVVEKVEARNKGLITINQVKNSSRPQDPPIDGLEVELYHIQGSGHIYKDLEVTAGITKLGYFEDENPHLHLGIIRDSTPVDPYEWLSSGNLGPYFTDREDINGRKGSYAQLPDLDGE